MPDMVFMPGGGGREAAARTPQAVLQVRPVFPGRLCLHITKQHRLYCKRLYTLLMDTFVLFQVVFYVYYLFKCTDEK